MVEEPLDDGTIRNVALASVVEMLIDCQAILDGYGLTLEAAHLDMTLNLMRQQVPVPEPAIEELMRKLGLSG